MRGVVLALALAASNAGRLTPSPAPAPSPDATCGTRGAVNGMAQGFCGHKTFDAGVDVISLDAGVLVCSDHEGQQNAPLATVSHNGANNFSSSVTWDQEPANTRTIDTYAWENGGTETMGLDCSTATYSSPSATPRLNVYGAISPYVIDNRSSGSTRSIWFTSNLAPNSGIAAVRFDQLQSRTSGQCQYTFEDAERVYGCFAPYVTTSIPNAVGSLSLTGQVGASGAVGATVGGSSGAFMVTQNGSGTVGMECDGLGGTSGGCYNVLLSHMFNGSNHGALTVLNDATLPDGGGRNMDGGLGIEFRNPGAFRYAPNTINDGVFDVTWTGGFGQPFRGATLGSGTHQLPPCPDPSPPANENGHGELASALDWASDTNRYYVCKVGDLPDAGNGGYVEIADSSHLQSGNVTLSSGTKSVNVFNSPTTCVCGKVTASANTCSCVLSGVVLTFTGTGSEQCSYICW